MINQKTIRITFFGDSIFVGQGVSIYRGWVTRLSQYLASYGERVGMELLVTNASVNGRTTRQALEDMPYTVQSHGVDILVVQFGLNDCNYWESDKGLPRVSVDAFQANLKEIIDRGFRFGSSHIILNNNHPTSRTTSILPHTDITYEESNRRYCEAVRSLASGFDDKVVFQDVYSHFSDLVETGSMTIDELLLPDGLHLSAIGHDAYFSFMKPVITQCIERHLGITGS